MTLNEAVNLFQSEKRFAFENKVYEIRNVKIVSGNLVIITDRKTFNLWEIEVKTFTDSVTFDVSEEKKTWKSSVIEAAGVSPGIEPLDVKKYWLPQGSMKAKDALENMLDAFADPENITDEMIKKATALCMISDKIVSVEKLQLDFVKLQKV